MMFKIDKSPETFTVDQRSNQQLTALQESVEVHSMKNLLLGFSFLLPLALGTPMVMAGGGDGSTRPAPAPAGGVRPHHPGDKDGGSESRPASRPAKPHKGKLGKPGTEGGAPPKPVAPGGHGKGIMAAALQGAVHHPAHSAGSGGGTSVHNPTGGTHNPTGGVHNPGGTHNPTGVHHPPTGHNPQPTGPTHNPPTQPGGGHTGGGSTTGPGAGNPGTGGTLAPKHNPKASKHNPLG